MEDVTPLNLEDAPKLFGLRYDQLIWCLGSFLVSTQIYSFFSPFYVAGQDLRLYICILIGLVGPVYCVVTIQGAAGNWGAMLNHFTGASVFIPGPDPNPVRFLIDEALPQFLE